MPDVVGAEAEDRGAAPHASSASVFWDGEELDIDDVSDAELRAITELQRMRAMRSPQQQLMDKNKKKLEKDSVTDLFRRSGKVQQQLLNRPRRVRKVRPAQPHIQIYEPSVQHSFTGFARLSLARNRISSKRIKHRILTELPRESGPLPAADIRPRVSLSTRIGVNGGTQASSSLTKLKLRPRHYSSSLRLRPPLRPAYLWKNIPNIRPLLPE